MDIVSTRAMDVAKLALDGLMKRQQAIASNTANVMTPGYQRKDVVFEDQLQEMLEKDNIKKDIKRINSAYYAHNSIESVTPAKTLKVLTQNSFDGYRPEIIRDNTVINPDTGNNVNVESEMMDMAKAGMQYTVLSTLEGKMFQSMTDIINSGG